MDASEPIDEAILRSIRAHRSGSVFSAKQFEGIGKAAAVRQALSRLAKAGKIRRIRQGLYDLPRKHPIIGQTAPDPMAAVRTLMEGSHAQWQVSGAYAANLLGLSQHVPARIVILTNGVPRRMSLGKLTLTFRRAAPRNLVGAGRPAGLVIQALRHLRAEGLDEARLSELRSRLDQSTRDELAELTPKLAAWMQPLMKRLTQEEKA
ncbi:MAG: DUF6088 family protein [Verrucomicrobia bacterium]|nr:DUF6088 family protein [Verrucomicrobiota bacterium]